LVGRADEFRIVSPRQIVVPGEGCLKSIGHVLRVGSTDPPEWFRRSGPLAVDFEAGVVYRDNRALAALKDMVAANHFCLLQGEAATGKTVLVRQLAYELEEQEGTKVYWFDCDRQRSFDRQRLVDEINMTHGVYILENVHLKTSEFQRVYFSVVSDPQRHVLFTARPSFRQTETAYDWLLSELPCAELGTTDGVGGLLEHFVCHYPGIHDRKRLRRLLISRSKGNLWRLCLMLQGCVCLEGDGEPKDRLEKGVHSWLDELWKLDPTFPAIVFALSPLYRHEVLTQRKYLERNLGFELDKINELAVRGEVTRQKGRDDFLYGLPHSALAEVCWQYGSAYRAESQSARYEDFICDYATSGVSNGLEAIVDAYDNECPYLLQRFMQSGKIHNVVRAETSNLAVDSWLKDISREYQVDREMLGILAEKILSCGLHYADSLFWPSYNLGGATLLELLGQRRLASRLNRSQEAWSVGYFIYRVRDVEGNFALSLCGRLNLNRLGQKWNGPLVDIIDICECIWYLSDVDPTTCRRLLARAKPSRIIAQFYAGDDDAGRADCMSMLHRVAPDMWENILANMDMKRLAEAIRQGPNLEGVFACVSRVWETDEKKGYELCQWLDLPCIGRRLCRELPIDLFAVYVRDMWQRQGELGRQLCQDMNVAQIAEKFSHFRYADELNDCLDVLALAMADRIKPILEAIDPNRIAKTLGNDSQEWCSASQFLQRITELDSSLGQKLCSFPELRELVGYMKYDDADKWSDS